MAKPDRTPARQPGADYGYGKGNGPVVPEKKGGKKDGGRRPVPTYGGPGGHTF